MSLLHHLLDRAALTCADKTGLVDGARRIAYRDFAAAARTCAAVLREHGLAPGDRVAVYLEKSCEEAYAIFGTSIAGGVIVPVNPLLRPRQIAHILGDCGVRFLITTARRHAELGAVLDGAPSLHRVLVVDEIPSRPMPALSPRRSRGRDRPRRPRRAPPMSWRRSSTRRGPPVCRRAPC
jgi:acyl-CoA synthetase (AMP-forming)/AMP-acid ligase II